MPIKPENKSRYPPNWKEITAAIRKRAEDKCEMCGLENGAIGYRDFDGDWIYSEAYLATKKRGYGYYQTSGYIKIVLTVAHLDHTPENCDENNLKALCQKCHNNYDKDHRKQTRMETKYKKQSKLF